MSASNNDERHNLSRDEIRDITDYLVEVIDGWEDTSPFRHDPEGDWRELEYRPDLKQNRLFPGVGYSQANEFATRFSRAVAAQEKIDPSVRERLRYFMFRYESEPTHPSALEKKLCLFSSKLRAASDDIRKIKVANLGQRTFPLLTGIHIRRSSVHPNEFDLHAHAVWEISDNNLDAVIGFLKRRFSEVWCDDDEVQDPGHLGFYVARGKIDYPDIQNWTTSQLRAVWSLGKINMVRTSGWLRTPSLVDAVGNSETTPNHQSPPVGVKMATESEKPAAEADDTAHVLKPLSSSELGDWLDAGEKALAEPDNPGHFRMMKPVRNEYRSDFVKPSIRAVSSEKRDLRAFPSIGEIYACSILVAKTYLFAENFSYSAFCREHDLDEGQLGDAVGRIQRYFNITLFHPGSSLVPTRTGLHWAKQMYEQLSPIRDIVNSARHEADMVIGTRKHRVNEWKRL